MIPYELQIKYMRLCLTYSWAIALANGWFS